MYVRNVFQFILENYKVSEAEAVEVWKKANWYGLFHPVALMVLVGGILARFWLFSSRPDILLYNFISLKDACLALVFLVYIFLWNALRIKYIKNHLVDRKIA